MISSLPQDADILIHGPFRQLSLLASSLLTVMCLYGHLQASGWYPFQHNPPHLANHTLHPPSPSSPQPSYY